MNERELGVLLVALAAVLIALAVTNVRDYQADLGFVRAAQRAYVWTDCTPIAGADLAAAQARPRRTCSLEEREHAFTITLAHVSLGALALTLVGGWLLAFGRGRLLHARR